MANKDVLTRNGLPINGVLNIELDRMSDYDVIDRLGDYVALVDSIARINAKNLRQFSESEKRHYEYLVDVYSAEAQARGLL